MKKIKEFKKIFDDQIEEYFKKKEKEFKSNEKLVKIIHRFVNSGGKRIRPAIFFYAYKTYKKKNLDEILKLSFVFELFHTFALIHDDIIDNSYLRRNQPTIHKKYDIATAILAGDIALILADELFYSQINKLKFLTFLLKRKIEKNFSLFKKEVIYGEYLDYIKNKDIYLIMNLKTANYSFVRPAQIGFLLANIPKKEEGQWKKILEKIGIIFQIKDDYNGTFSEEKIIGKPADSDFKEGKNTLISKKFLEKINDQEKKFFLNFFGKRNCTKDVFSWYLKTLKKYNIDQEIKNLIIKNATKIKEIINKKFRQKELAALLLEIIDEIMKF